MFTAEMFNKKLCALVDLFCEEQLAGGDTNLDETETCRQFRTWLEQLYEVGGLGDKKQHKM